MSRPPGRDNQNPRESGTCAVACGRVPRNPFRTMNHRLANAIGLPCRSLYFQRIALDTKACIGSVVPDSDRFHLISHEATQRSAGRPEEGSRLTACRDLSCGRGTPDTSSMRLDLAPRRFDQGRERSLCRRKHYGLCFFEILIHFRSQNDWRSRLVTPSRTCPASGGPSVFGRIVPEAPAPVMPHQIHHMSPAVQFEAGGQS